MLSGMNVRTIDCDDCAMAGTDACDDCVVSFILRREPGEALVIDAEEERALRTLAGRRPRPRAPPPPPPRQLTAASDPRTRAGIARDTPSDGGLRHRKVLRCMTPYRSIWRAPPGEDLGIS